MTRKLPDQAQRDAIATDLDTTMLVEAAAGTGKTTAMVGRMIRLLAEGKCRIGTLAAVTFTRKSTAELRDRFRTTLERAVRDAAGAQRERLDEALRHVEQCFIGTIHAFCARLLRERPIEARIDVAFEELDEDEEFRLRSAAWDEYVATLYAADAPLLARLDELGLTPADLRSAYIAFAEYPDVEDWPRPAVTFDETLADAARRAVRDYAKHMEAVAPGLPRSFGTDKLMPFFRDFPRRLRYTRLGENRSLVDVLKDIASVKVTMKYWPRGTGREERDRHAKLVADYATPLQEQWWQVRYGPVLDLLQGAAARYDAMRADHGVLSYQDLLMKAATLLRDQPHVRGYFRRRFTHLLVDEFQDTDPIQAEVMLLLTADDTGQRDWRLCRPVPGSLFVVGDPKQAIYRFRRADIVTYNEVRRIIEGCGRIVHLSANFRSTAPLIRWFNTASATLFPAASDYAPADSPMDFPGISPSAPSTAAGGDVMLLEVPGNLKRAEVNRLEADAIARLIRDWVDREGYAPGDFLILSRVRGPLAEYARALAAQGLPVEVTGGTAVNELDEAALLHAVLAAVVEPDNPVALVGVLRSELFGISDTALYRFRKAVGVFNIFVSGDHEAGDEAAAIDETRERLRRYAGWLSRLQPVAAVERIAGDVGLLARAAATEDGRDRAGGLCKTIELLRAASREYWTAGDLVRYLWNLVNPQPEILERRDGASLSPHDVPPVRVMNLHQAKGLEAPVVFLADGSGDFPDDVSLYVDRRGGVVCGYLQLREPRPASRRWGRGSLLAQPAGWADKEQQERRFQDAEADRLLYVAATRAARRLIISRPAGAKTLRWEKLIAHVPDGAVLAEFPDVAPPAAERLDLPADAPQRFADDLAARWTMRTAPTYDVRQVKTLTVTGSAAAAHPGEHGTEWGTVLHVLLEAAMNDPSVNLEPLAAAALGEVDLDPAAAPEALLVIRSVMRSDLWERARAAGTRMTEVPVQFMQHPEGGVPTLVRGVIDLAFREREGWVIVDYKTDDREGEPLEPLVEHYTGQVCLYARAWAELTGEHVAETGLYFVRTGRYREVSCSGSGTCQPRT